MLRAAVRACRGAFFRARDRVAHRFAHWAGVRAAPCTFLRFTLRLWGWWRFLRSALHCSAPPLASWLWSVEVRPLSRLRGQAYLFAEGWRRIHLRSPDAHGALRDHAR